MLKIWGRSNSINVQKVMWTVGELGLEHQRIDVGGSFGGLNDAAFGRLNPNRLVPAVEDGGTVVWESQACVRYLAARYDPGGLWPQNPAARASADKWMDWKITRIIPLLTTCFWGLIRTAEAERDMAAIGRAAAGLAKLWPILDQQLDATPFVAGERLTIGDIPLGAAFYRYSNLPIERPSLPRIDAWYERLRAREPYQTHVMIPLS